MLMKRYNGKIFESVNKADRYTGTAWTPCQNGRRFDGSNWVNIFSPTQIQFTSETMAEWCTEEISGQTLSIAKQNELGIRFFESSGASININSNNQGWKNPWRTDILATENKIGQYFTHEFICNTLDLDFGGSIWTKYGYVGFEIPNSINDLSMITDTALSLYAAIGSGTANIYAKTYDSLEDFKIDLYTNIDITTFIGTIEVVQGNDASCTVSLGRVLAQNLNTKAVILKFVNNTENNILCIGTDPTSENYANYPPTLTFTVSDDNVEIPVNYSWTWNVSNNAIEGKKNGRIQFDGRNTWAYEIYIYDLDDAGEIIKNSEQRFPKDTSLYYDCNNLIEPTGELGINNKLVKVVVVRNTSGIYLGGISSYNL